MSWRISVRWAIGHSASREPQLRSRSKAWFPLTLPAGRIGMKMMMMIGSSIEGENTRRLRRSFECWPQRLQ